MFALCFSGPPIGDRLAKIVNKGLRRRPDSKAQKKWEAAYLKPENVPCLTVPALNGDLHPGRGFSMIDVAVRKTQKVRFSRIRTFICTYSLVLVKPILPMS
jgi:hypothetical protein